VDAHLISDGGMLVHDFDISDLEPCLILRLGLLRLLPLPLGVFCLLLLLASQHFHCVSLIRLPHRATLGTWPGNPIQSHCLAFSDT
jgi:hypothetical protein